MGSKFIILFQEKEGTSVLVRLLNNFEHVSIVHQVKDKGWEPFDNHNCGSMPLKNLRQCLDLIYSDKPLDMENLNRIYTKTAKRPLEIFNKNNAVGFKMRFYSPYLKNLWIERKIENFKFKKLMFNQLEEHDVVVFIAVRQNVFRWALSKYHGDGSGKPGNLQFKLASQLINRENIPKINIDCNRLERIIAKCERTLQKKKSFIEKLEKSGIKTYPLFYEEFCDNKYRYFEKIFSQLELEVSKEKIETAINKGTYLRKVHSDNISEFVVNHQEVIDRFEGRYVGW